MLVLALVLISVSGRLAEETKGDVLEKNPHLVVRNIPEEDLRRYSTKKHYPLIIKKSVVSPPFSLLLDVFNMGHKHKKEYPVFIERRVRYPVEKEVPVPQKVFVQVPKPYRVPVVVEKKVPVVVEKIVPIRVEVPVDKPYPLEVEVPYDVEVVRKMPVVVEKEVPYELKVPEYVEVPVPVFDVPAEGSISEDEVASKSEVESLDEPE